MIFFVVVFFFCSVDEIDSKVRREAFARPILTSGIDFSLRKPVPAHLQKAGVTADGKHFCRDSLVVEFDRDVAGDADVEARKPNLRLVLRGFCLLSLLLRIANENPSSVLKYGEPRLAASHDPKVGNRVHDDFLQKQDLRFLGELPRGSRHASEGE